MLPKGTTERVTIRTHKGINRRVSVGKFSDDSCMLTFKILDGDTSPRTQHFVNHGMVTTKIQLTKEAIDMLMDLLLKTYYTNPKQ
jgi:hypothetical protein